MLLRLTPRSSRSLSALSPPVRRVKRDAFAACVASNGAKHVFSTASSVGIAENLTPSAESHIPAEPVSASRLESQLPTFPHLELTTPLFKRLGTYKFHPYIVKKELSRVRFTSIVHLARAFKAAHRSGRLTADIATQFLNAALRIQDVRRDVINKFRRGELDRIAASKYAEAMNLLNARLQKIERKVARKSSRSEDSSSEERTEAEETQQKKKKNIWRDGSDSRPRFEKKSQRNLKRHSILLPRMHNVKRVRSLFISDPVAPVVLSDFLPVLQQNGLIQYPLVQLWLAIALRESREKDPSTGVALGQVHFDAILAIDTFDEESLTAAAVLVDRGHYDWFDQLYEHFSSQSNETLESLRRLREILSGSSSKEYRILKQKIASVPRNEQPVNVLWATQLYAVFRAAIHVQDIPTALEALIRISNFSHFRDLYPLCWMTQHDEVRAWKAIFSHWAQPRMAPPYAETIGAWKLVLRNKLAVSEDFLYDVVLAFRVPEAAEKVFPPSNTASPRQKIINLAFMELLARQRKFNEALLRWEMFILPTHDPWISRPACLRIIKLAREQPNADKWFPVFIRFVAATRTTSQLHRYDTQRIIFETLQTLPSHIYAGRMSQALLRLGVPIDPRIAKSQLIRKSAIREAIEERNAYLLKHTLSIRGVTMSTQETLPRILFRVVQQYFPAASSDSTTSASGGGALPSTSVSNTDLKRHAWINVHLTPTLLSQMSRMKPFETFVLRRFFKMFKLSRKLELAAAELKEQMSVEIMRNLVPVNQYRYFERATPEEQEQIKATAAQALAYKPKKWLETHIAQLMSTPLQNAIINALYNEVHETELKGTRDRSRWGRAVEFLNFENFLLEPTSIPPPTTSPSGPDCGLWTVSLNIGSNKHIGIGQADNLEDAIFDLAYLLLDPEGVLVANLPEATVSAQERAALIAALRKKREEDFKSNTVRETLNRIADAKAAAMRTTAVAQAQSSPN